jgi:hypothetical protein
MTTVELKKLIIQKISGINDISFLKTLRTIPYTKTEKGAIQLTREQLEDIIASKKEIEEGLFSENSTLDKEVHKWLNAG